jgi:hypothetical protein
LDDSNPDPALAELVAVLTDARAMLASDGNNFASSSWWKSAADALREVDRLIAALESGEHPRRLDLEVLFAPTGPMQEVSANRGWGDAFLALARRFDAALLKVYKR